MPQPQSPSVNSCASTVSVVSERTQAVRSQYFFERRLLFACSLLVGIAIILWITSISTNYWFWIDGGDGIWINETKRYFLKSHSGLFKICRYSKSNSTSNKLLLLLTTTTTTTTTAAPPAEGEEIHETHHFDNVTGHRHIVYRKCKYHDVFPSEAKVLGDPMLDMTILNYTRTEIMFSLISLCVMIMALFFSIYTFNNPRYMFKRLAGGIHFISALSIIVVIEILMQSIDYEREYLPVVHPAGSTHRYGYSYGLACTVFLLNLTAGIAFMWYSKKRKGNKAPNEEVAMADEPAIIGW